MARSAQTTRGAKTRARATPTRDEGLEHVLADLREVAGGAKLRPATAASLAAIEKVLGAVPADLRALYGLAANLDAVIGGSTSLEWLSNASAVKICKQNREYGTPERLFPIATDGAGNFSCFDRDTGRIVDWDHETRKTRALAPTLASYLRSAVVGTLQRTHDENVVIEREQGKRVALETEMPASPTKLVLVENAFLSARGGERGALRFVGDNSILVAGEYESSQLLELSTQEVIEVPAGGDGAGFDPSTKRLLLAKHGTIALADATTGKALARFRSSTGHVSSVNFSPNGSIAVVCSTTGVIQIWDTKTGNGIPKELKGELTPSYDLPEGTPLASLAGHQGGASTAPGCVRFSPDGALLATADKDGKVCLWNVVGTSLKTSAIGKGEIHCIDFARDGLSLFVGTGAGTVEVLDLNLKRLGRWESRCELRDFRILANGMLAAIDSKAITLWTPSGHLISKIARPKKPGPGWAFIADVRGDLLLVRAPPAAVLVRVT